MLWLRRDPRPQGRFNAGQKVNAALTAAFAVLFAVSGLAALARRARHRFQLASTILLHDGLTLVSLVLLVGHLYLALIHPATRHALRGMTARDGRRDWAERHHPKCARATTMSEMATVLVVDDEPIVRDVVVRYLQRDGFDTLEAGDGDAARAMIESEAAEHRRARRDAARARTGSRSAAGSARAATCR